MVFEWQRWSFVRQPAGPAFVLLIPVFNDVNKAARGGPFVFASQEGRQWAGPHLTAHHWIHTHRALSGPCQTETLQLVPASVITLIRLSPHTTLPSHHILIPVYHKAPFMSVALLSRYCSRSLSLLGSIQQYIESLGIQWHSTLMAGGRYLKPWHWFPLQQFGLGTVCMYETLDPSA